MEYREAGPRLVPVLRGASSPQQAWRLAARDPDRALLRQRFVPFLHALCAIDKEDRLLYVSRGDLASWDQGGDAVFARARQNLDPTGGLVRREDDGLWQLKAGDGYESSRLLLPRWLAAFTDHVGGRPIAAVPHARFLVVGGERDLSRLLLLARLGFEQAGTPISPAVYTADDDGKVVPYLPADDHPLRVSVENAHKLLLRAEYERQRDALQELAGGTVLASAGLVQQTKGGRMLSVCAWTEGTTALLPLTDVVVMHPRSGGARWVPRALLADVAGDCLEILDIEPPRLRTLHWPEPIAFARLEAGALAVES